MILENNSEKNMEIILHGIKTGDQIGGPYQLARILVKSLIANKSFNQEDLKQRYLNWWRKDAFDTGPTYASVFTKVLNGYKHADAVLETHNEFGKETAGCGPAHRSSPLAGFNKLPTEKLVKIVKQEAKITHFHEDAGNGSAIVVLLCRYLLEGKNLDQAIFLISNNNDLKVSWRKVENAKLSPNGYVFNVIYSALHFIRNGNSLEESIKFSGKANYSTILFSVIKTIITKTQYTFGDNSRFRK